MQLPLTQQVYIKLARFIISNQSTSLYVDADDYEEITTSNDPLLSFTEDPSTHQQCFNVTITDDEFLEDTERFSLVLSLAEGSTVPVEIMPPTSEVEITDDDCMIIIIE